MDGENGRNQARVCRISCPKFQNRAEIVRLGVECDVVLVWLACHGLEEAFEFLLQRAIDSPEKFAVMNEKAVDGRQGRGVFCRAGDSHGNETENEKITAVDRGRSAEGRDQSDAKTGMLVHVGAIKNEN